MAAADFKMARVLFYVQHLLGIGHQMRAAAITRAMTTIGLDVTYVTGGFTDTALNLGGVKIVQLPPVRAQDATFKTMLDEFGHPIDAAWENRRRDALLRAYSVTAPDVLLIEGYPFARRRFRFELLPLLQTAQESGVPVAVSVRDILAAKSNPARVQEVVDIVQKNCAAVLVHGDPSLITLDKTFAAAAKIADKIRYTGYVSAPSISLAQHAPTRNGVVVSVGGGAVGGTLLRCALAARPLTRLRDAPWRLITGPNLPKSDQHALARSGGVTIEQFNSDFRKILSHCALSISQAGYNTVMDVLATSAPSILVPFAQDGETEQTVRAKLLARHPGFQFISEAELTPARLAATVDAVVDAPPSPKNTLNRNGAAETAKILLGLTALKH